MNVFFTDRDLGHEFPAILSSAGMAVELHDKHFAPNTPDEHWLKHAGTRGWFVLTRDTHIRYRPNERDAVMSNGVGMFLLVGNVPHRQLAENFVATQRTVDRFIAANPRPFIAKIYRPARSHGVGAPGSVSMWLDEKAWRRGRHRR